MSFLKRTQKEAKRKRTRVELSPLYRQLIWGGILFVTLAVVLTALWYISRVPSFQIERIEVIGGKTIPHARVEGIVNGVLQGEYVRFIPKRFIPLYPKGGIESALKSVDRIKNVQIELSDDQTLLVVFEEHIPYALWCATAGSESCLFIDQTGFAFAFAPSLEGSAFVRYVDEGITPERDVSGFASEFIKQAELFTSLLETELNLYVTHVHKRSSYDVDYTISGGGLIKVSQAIPTDDTFENLQSILLSDAFKHIEPGSFQYIDLRFGEKIFVNEEKLNEEAATSAASTSNSF